MSSPGCDLPRSLGGGGEGWRRHWRGREAESLWKTEGRLMTKEIAEIQIKATIQNLDKETAGISVVWVTASLLPSDLTANKSSTPESKQLIRGLF